VPIVQIEHGGDYAAWKAIFDEDRTPVSRKASGVLRHRIARRVDDPNYVIVDLEFADMAAAETFRDAIQGLWDSRPDSPGLAGRLVLRIVDVAEEIDY